MRRSKKSFLVIGFMVTILSYMLLYFGIKMILGSQITMQNVIAYLIVSLIFGATSSTLCYLQLKVACIAMLSGLLIGFIDMYRIFFTDMNGWGDLVGLLSLFTWATIGLFAGVIGQLGWYLYKKINSHRNKQ